MHACCLPLSDHCGAVCLPFAAGEAAPPTTALCGAAIATAEDAFRLPPHLLKAIAQVESGRPDPATGRLQAWPWTINAEGQGAFFATEAQAVAAVEGLAVARRAVDRCRMPAGQSDVPSGGVCLAGAGIRSAGKCAVCCAVPPCIAWLQQRLVECDCGLPLADGGAGRRLSPPRAGVVARSFRGLAFGPGGCLSRFRRRIAGIW